MHHVTSLLYLVQTVASHNKLFTNCGMRGKHILWTPLILWKIQHSEIWWIICLWKKRRGHQLNIQSVKKFRMKTLRVCRGNKTKPFCYVTNIWQVLCFLARGPWRVWCRMVLQKLLKMLSVYINAQLVSACKWLCLTNNCCSFCHTGNQLFWSVYQCLVHQTLHLPPDKEIQRSEIGRTWWPLYWTTPPNPVIGENIVQVFSDIKGKVCWGPVMLEP